MDSTLSEFVVRTSADPGLARDLLNAHDWNLQNALSAYYVMKGFLPGEVPRRRESLLSQSLGTSAVHPANSFISKEESNITTTAQRQEKDAEEKNDHQEEICKKLTRGFSRATDNLNLISQARTEFAQDFDSFSQDGNRCPSSKLEIPDHTFTLPNIASYPAPLQKYLQQDLIEMATLVSLRQAGRLNWWYKKNICQELWPLATTGDGNCLLHAASLGMWGFHDRLLTLRKALHNLLTSSAYTDAFYRRWRWQTSMQNKESGLIYSEEEWEREWQNLLKISSTEPRTNGSQGKSEEKLSDVYESLEELHVFILAHVLRRPVIVIADTMLRDLRGEPFAPIPFGGIYLPVEYTPSECHRSPLCLAYDSAHFSALVPMDDNGESELSEIPSKKLLTAIPVTDPENSLLHLHFAIDPGSEVNWGHDENDPCTLSRLNLKDEDKLLLLNDYLDIRTFPISYASGNVAIESKASKHSSGKSSSSHEPDYDSDNSIAGSGISCTGNRTHRSKAARQLQTVAKQFGSIGKSVSRKLKHIGDMARQRNSFRGETRAFKLVPDGAGEKRSVPSGRSCGLVNGISGFNQVVIALIHTDKKHEYQKQMINNYLNSVISRFEKEKERKSCISSMGTGHVKQSSTMPTKCSNLACSMYNKSSKDYLCDKCYDRHQKDGTLMKRIALSHHQEKTSEYPIFTYGKSLFYTEIDKSALESIRNVPLSRQYSQKSSRWDGSSFCGKPAVNGVNVYPSTFSRVSVKL